MQLSIVTPSLIDRTKRKELARRSLASLREATKDAYRHVIVSDIVHPRWLKASRETYDRPGAIHILRSGKKGSAEATLCAVRETRRQGADLVFIHLDDDVYVPELEALLKHSIDAFEKDEKLTQIRLVGYPVINRNCTAELGNRTQITIEEEEVSFPGVRLRASREENYTLWWARYESGVFASRCWPVVLWLTVYRADFLEALLSGAREQGLGGVELFYKNKANWPKAWLSQRLGFINMQFGGLEMQRNKEWKETIRVPNAAVR